MGGIFTSLNTSYTGLQAHQAMVDTTGNNIANANDEFYSRQKVIVKPQSPLDKGTYHLGTGVQIQSIVRAHDEFIFQRYSRAAQEKEFYQTQFDKLRETSSLFPDLEGVGIYEDLQQYFNAWKNFSKDAKDPAQKQLLIQSTQTLLRSIHASYNNLATMQKKTSQELALRIDEVNRLGQQIADINKQLSVKESKVDLMKANDLRDQRDKLEFQLKELIGGSVFKTNLKSDIGIASRDIDYGENYVLNIAGGFNIVDGVNFHPLSTKESHLGNELHHVYFQNQDHRPVDITNYLLDGKIGGLIKLYADGIDGTTPGKIQKYIDMLNVFAKTFIETTNNIYAQSATRNVESDYVELLKDQSLVDSQYNIRQGSFDLVIYDLDGQELATKTIVISPTTTIKEVVEQINANTDDNADQNSLNDIDDYFSATFDSQTGKFQISPKNQNDIYIGIRDNGSNFAGSLGINRFFDGNSAKNISINETYVQDPTKLRAWGAPSSGNTDVANMMQQMQYDDLSFQADKNTIQKMQLTQYYQLLGGEMATDTQAVKTALDTKTALFAAAQKEHQSISQVSVDEEMVNLVKFQSGYAANAKVVSTIDKMIDTLLGLKQ
ncbi:flagellar hook-associated protein FlgK [Helicobacter kayseriensis]|uniref:flagellar hook-associated protein FlgK n=1 Tax=Helicobacter kayseriensis TaxID=2905877 RepID=UPI001E5A2C5D|nr:flagellar hook-associated protein FlgK [Helicobacter kayseriensis]MCE3046909.1 flagellar hook-associated protein FlgK [Helicobacter kayseriensis]MCE3048431.1 flagellar hook-associated protein FlgK [Helicobacter kayseriensis]